MPELLDTGAMVAHYRLASKLGEGGMGAVFLAHDTRLDRPVALKILSREFAQDPERLQRFLQEAKLASALSHPNVAYIYEIGESEGAWFLAMEYVEGIPLNARVAEGSLSCAEIIRIGIETADALDSAHSKGIIHRDIKPANLMLASRVRVNILDFGLAKM